MTHYLQKKCVQTVENWPHNPPPKKKIKKKTSKKWVNFLQKIISWNFDNFFLKWKKKISINKYNYQKFSANVLHIMKKCFLILNFWLKMLHLMIPMTMDLKRKKRSKLLMSLEEEAVCQN